MGEVKEQKAGKSRIETLSDLIFGLALSIGALTLIGQPPSDFAQLLQSILFYAFSFLILISVWYAYTRNMSLLRVESGKLVSLNVLLLFLVSIEPYLFNQLFGASASLVENTSLLYALDLGGLFVIQAFFAHIIFSDRTNTEHIRQSYKFRRNIMTLSAVLFFVSIVPSFWVWGLYVDHINIPLRVMLWLIPLFIPSIIRVQEAKDKRARQTKHEQDRSESIPSVQGLTYTL